MAASVSAGEASVNARANAAAAKGGVTASAALRQHRKRQEERERRDEHQATHTKIIRRRQLHFVKFCPGGTIPQRLKPCPCFCFEADASSAQITVASELRCAQF